MAKLTYSQQLADPRWQRRRLQILELAGWECNDCGNGALQLHVHHPRYIKGRMAWEYEDDELQVLCVDCHKAHHEFETTLANASHASVYGHRFIEAVSAGFLNAALDLDMDQDALMAAVCPDGVMAGQFAYMFFHAKREEKKLIAQILARSDQPRNPVEANTIDAYGGYDVA